MQLIIGFSKSIKVLPIGSWLIRLFDWTPYSHVYIKYRAESLDRLLIYQATGKGVNFSSNSSFLSHNAIVEEYALDISEIQKVELLKSCIDYSGVDYSLRDLFGIVVVRLVSIFGYKIKNPLGDKNAGYICSGIVVQLLENLNFTKDLDPDLMTPKDVNLLLKNLAATELL